MNVRLLPVLFLSIVACILVSPAMNVEVTAGGLPYLFHCLVLTTQLAENSYTTLFYATVVYLVIYTAS